MSSAVEPGVGASVPFTVTVPAPPATKIDPLPDSVPLAPTSTELVL
jgi:hypothetical protein